MGAQARKWMIKLFICQFWNISVHRKTVKIPASPALLHLLGSILFFLVLFWVWGVEGGPYKLVGIFLLISYDFCMVYSVYIRPIVVPLVTWLRRWRLTTIDTISLTLPSPVVVRLIFSRASMPNFSLNLSLFDFINFLIVERINS